MRGKNLGTGLLIQQDSTRIPPIRKNSKHLHLPVKKLPLFSTSAKSHWAHLGTVYPAFCQGAPKSWNVCSHLHGPLHYLKLESYYIINTIVNIYTLYLYFYRCQTPERPELKEFFAFAGPDAPTWSVPSCADSLAEICESCPTRSEAHSRPDNGAVWTSSLNR